MVKRAPVRLGIALFSLGGLLFFWWEHRPKPLPVPVSAVRQGTVERIVANTRGGTVRACRRARLAPSLGGQIAKLTVRKGDRVGAGALLLELWNQDLQAQVRLAEREAEAALAKARARCLNAKNAAREAERQIKLKEKGLASEEALDRAVTAAQVGQADCEAAQANARVRSARLGVAQAKLEKTRLRAPFAGVIAEVSGELNEYVTPSPPGIPTPPAVDLIDDSCFYISAPIDEVDAAQVQLGDETRVTLDAFGDQVFPGTVRRIAPYVLDREKQARTVEVEVGLQEMPQSVRLLAGYSADVEIIVERREHTKYIPTAALDPDHRVLVLDPETGRLVQKQVEIGLSNWDRTEVRSGLVIGDLVVNASDQEGIAPGVLAVPAEAQP